ncbi:hypothetical protein [Xenorhabdus ehlersii]|uniref:Uncharacterized protein n=1 Tax=Xenorhabdus ehlersii TaxID=290111 RepID=A0A2D0IMA8_9GAMM|nr:hypothetical protein [Xenorhabdus ehlersii]PHM22963.1 hypothetical protein Xehl_03197 [Xenorhabdus ehlersii]RKE92631.1 hypothetical protein BDE27_0287 [Xenorhabdus ehlersii]
MKVTIDMNKKEVREYVNSDYPVPESEYPELIRGDVKTILLRAGFQGIKLEDVTVKITDD